MNKRVETPPSDLTLVDIYFILFRRKWTILFFAAMGVLAAGVLWFVNPPQYRSEAELSLRLVEAPMILSKERTRPNSEPSENSIKTEINILESLDLARQVVRELTPSTILEGTGLQANTDIAAELVKKGVSIEQPLNSSLVDITFVHPNADVVQPALKALISRGIQAAAYDLPDNFISIIESPTPPRLSWSKRNLKLTGLFAGGGIFFGLALAFFRERVLDCSVKRPVEIEERLGLPLLISIPAVRRMHYKRWRRGSERLMTDTSGGRIPLRVSVAPWDREHPLRRFYEGLRDQLIVQFKARNLTQKPKLVAVTSCGRGAGVSSIATGLAATLSETGDGNVLLINSSGARNATQQFHKGELESSLDEVLETDRKCTLVTASIYTLTDQTKGDIVSGTLPRRVSALMPKLKASEYDYIIFDLPPVNETTATARLSGFMDTVLLVIEAEKTHRDVVKRVTKLLAQSEAIVSTVFDKARNYIPVKLHQEFLNDA